MKKIHSIYLMSLVVLTMGLLSCNDNDVLTNEDHPQQNAKADDVSQDSQIRFIEQGKTWTVFNHDKESRLNYRIDGDTLISNKKCAKMFTEHPKFPANNTVEYLYEEGGKVYNVAFFIDSDVVEFNLMYDFGAKKGDVLTVYSRRRLANNDLIKYKYTPEGGDNFCIPHKVEVLEEKVVNILGMDRRCLLIDSSKDVNFFSSHDYEVMQMEPQMWWIEGIGAACYPAISFLPQYAVALMECYNSDGQVYYNYFAAKSAGIVAPEHTLSWLERYIEPQMEFKYPLKTE